MVPVKLVTSRFSMSSKKRSGWEHLIELIFSKIVSNPMSSINFLTAEILLFSSAKETVENVAINKAKIREDRLFIIFQFLRKKGGEKNNKEKRFL